MAGRAQSQMQLFAGFEEEDSRQQDPVSDDDSAFDQRVIAFLQTLVIDDDSNYDVDANPADALALGAMMEQRARAVRIQALAHALVSGVENGKPLQTKRRGDYQTNLIRQMRIYEGAWLEFAGVFGFVAGDQARAFVCEAGGY